MKRKQGQIIWKKSTDIQDITEKQELKIKQMTTDIADMIEKDTAVPQGNDGIF